MHAVYRQYFITNDTERSLCYKECSCNITHSLMHMVFSLSMIMTVCLSMQNDFAALLFSSLFTGLSVNIISVSTMKQILP